MEQYLKQGLVSDSKVLDIRQVEVRYICFHIHTILKNFVLDFPRENSRERNSSLCHHVRHTRNAHLPEREEW